MKILEYPNESLSQVCSDVVSFDSQLHKLLDSMKDLMYESGGVGLAANQIGESCRVFVMIGEDERTYEMVNPEIVDQGAIKQDLFREGCLSSKGVYEYVPRYEWVVVRFQDRFGVERELYATKPRDSVCVQHELDHLSGVFWWDKLPKNVRKRLIRKFDKKRRS